MEVAGITFVFSAVIKVTEAPVETTSSRMSYSRFLEYLNQGAVKKVDFFENNVVPEILINPALNKVQKS